MGFKIIKLKESANIWARNSTTANIRELDSLLCAIFDHYMGKTNPAEIKSNLFLLSSNDLNVINSLYKANKNDQAWLDQHPAFKQLEFIVMRFLGNWVHQSTYSYKAPSGNQPWSKALVDNTFWCLALTFAVLADFDGDILQVIKNIIKKEGVDQNFWDIFTQCLRDEWIENVIEKYFISYWKQPAKNGTAAEKRYRVGKPGELMGITDRTKSPHADRTGNGYLYGIRLVRYDGTNPVSKRVTFRKCQNGTYKIGITDGLNLAELDQVYFESKVDAVNFLNNIKNCGTTIPLERCEGTVNDEYVHPNRGKPVKVKTVCGDASILDTSKYYV